MKPRSIVYDIINDHQKQNKIIDYLQNHDDHPYSQIRNSSNSFLEMKWDNPKNPIVIQMEPRIIQGQYKTISINIDPGELEEIYSKMVEESRIKASADANFKTQKNEIEREYKSESCLFKSYGESKKWPEEDGHQWRIGFINEYRKRTESEKNLILSCQSDADLEALKLTLGKLSTLNGETISHQERIHEFQRINELQNGRKQRLDDPEFVAEKLSNYIRTKYHPSHLDRGSEFQKAPGQIENLFHELGIKLSHHDAKTIKENIANIRVVAEGSRLLFKVTARFDQEVDQFILLGEMNQTLKNIANDQSIRDSRHTLQEILEGQKDKKLQKASRDEEAAIKQGIQQSKTEREISQPKIESKEKQEIEPQVTQSEQPAARLYLDFDGTLTGLSGDDTVKSDNSNYMSLLQESRLHLSILINSNENIFLDHDKMVEKIKNEFPANMKLCSGTKDFLEKMAANHTEIIIVSNNRKEYIQAVLEAGGVGRDVIDKIEIHDRLESGSKQDIVKGLETTRHDNVPCFVADDTLKNCQEMKEGINQGRPGKYSNVVHQHAGMFNWPDIGNKLSTLSEKMKLIDENQYSAQKMNALAVKMMKLVKGGEGIKKIENGNKIDAINSLDAKCKNYEKVANHLSSFDEVKKAYQEMRGAFDNLEKVTRKEKGLLETSRVLKEVTATRKDIEEHKFRK